MIAKSKTVSSKLSNTPNIQSYKIKDLSQKEKCFDYFQDFKLNNYKMYQFKPAKDHVNYKIRKQRLHKFHERIRILKNLKVFSGYGQSSYISIVLKDILLIKQMFIMDVEQGEEVAIPFDLNQSKLPLSYQFYNPIMNITQKMISEDIRGFVSLKYNYLL